MTRRDKRGLGIRAAAAASVLLTGGLLIVIGFAVSAYWPRDAAMVREGRSPVTARVSTEALDSGQVLRIRLANQTGVAVNARVLLPSFTGDGLRPIIILGGHETGSRAVELVGVQPGIALMALDYPYDGKFEADGVLDLFWLISDARRTSLKTPAAVSMAVSWLEEQPWAQGNSVEVVGVSLGVPYAATAAALDERIAKLWLVHGAAENGPWLDINTALRIDNPLLSRTVSRLIYWTLCAPLLHAGERTQAVAPRPIVIIGARDDKRTPREAVLELYERTPHPKRLLWTDGGHIDPGRPQTIAQLLSFVENDPFSE